MKPDIYREIRQSVGTQAEVARRLGVHPQTISDRERGVYPIDREAALAIKSIALDSQPAVAVK